MVGLVGHDASLSLSISLPLYGGVCQYCVLGGALTMVGGGIVSVYGAQAQYGAGLVVFVGREGGRQAGPSARLSLSHAAAWLCSAGGHA